MSLRRVSPSATGWLNAVEVRHWRVLTAARVFALATALGVAAASGAVGPAATAFLALCVLATVMSIPIPFTWVRAATPIAEGALAALILGSAGDSGTSLLVYLVVPPLAAGLQAGRSYAVTTVVAECVAELAALLTGHTWTATREAMLELGPWLLVGTGMGLLGAWMRAHTPVATVDQAGYESAHRLLAQLRVVSRRLSAGLDITALAQHTLSRCVEDTAAHRAVLLVRSEGRNLVPLVGHADMSLFDALEEDEAVLECWAAETPVQRRMPSGSALTRHRVALPMRVGARTIGVVVCDAPASVDEQDLRHLQGFLAEQSLRLETALLFDEVRSLATIEERYRLAREIHDGVAQEVASLGYLVDAMTASSDLNEVRESASDLRKELSRIVGELRLSIFDLRSGVRTHGGLGAALASYADEVGAHSRMTVHLALAEHPRRMRVDVETELLRIAQEAITNARKHAQADNLWVTLSTESSLVRLSIEDDGVGAPTERPDHYGLPMMRERADRVGADLAITDRPGGGTCVSVTLERGLARNPGVNSAHRVDSAHVRTHH